MSVYQLRLIEVQLGSLQFVNITTILMLLPDVVTLCMFVLLIRQGQEQHRHSCCVGYSGVVFGWMTIVTQRVSSYCPLPFGGEHLCFATHQIPLPNGQSMPINIAPFVSLGFVQLVFPRAAFHAHLGGILVGYLIAWGLHWELVGFITPALVTKGVVIVALVSPAGAPSGATEVTSSKHACVMKGLAALNLCVAVPMAYCFSWNQWVSQLMSCVLNVLAWQRIPNTSNLTLIVVTFCAAIDACVTSVDCIFLILFWSELGVVHHRLFFGLCVLVAAIAIHSYNSWATHAMYRSRTDPTCHDSHFGWVESQPHSVPFSGRGRTLAEV